VPPTVHLPHWCHFRVHEALFSRAAINLVWGLKPPVRLAQGSVQWERSGLEEGRQHLHDRSGRVSRAEGAKSLRGEARVEDCRDTSRTALGADVQTQGRGHWLISGSVRQILEQGHQPSSGIGPPGQSGTLCQPEGIMGSASLPRPGNLEQH